MGVNAVYDVGLPEAEQDTLRATLGCGQVEALHPLLAFVTQQLLEEVAVFRGRTDEVFDEARGRDAAFRERQHLVQLFARNEHVLSAARRALEEARFRAMQHIVDGIFHELTVLQFRDIVGEACYELDEGIDEPLCGEPEA